MIGLFIGIILLVSLMLLINTIIKLFKEFKNND